MARYKVKLSTTISDIEIIVEADSVEDAENKWDDKPEHIQQAINQVIDQARILDAYEFDIEDVEDLEAE